MIKLLVIYNIILLLQYTNAVPTAKYNTNVIVSVMSRTNELYPQIVRNIYTLNIQPSDIIIIELDSLINKSNFEFLTKLLYNIRTQGYTNFILLLKPNITLKTLSIREAKRVLRRIRWKERRNRRKKSRK
jgi:hypothetical protein